MDIKRLEELQAWALDVLTSSVRLQQNYDDVAAALGELIARRRVSQAQWKARHDEDHE
jgi:hypothetical protein